MAVQELRKQGSSPLSRGIRSRWLLRRRRRRIIPALAGNTCLCPPRRRGSTDHPRSRGEYLTTVPDQSLMSGSSPLSRGILAGGTVKPHYDGIIPALAGNTPAKRQLRPTPRDHPRSRGEYASQATTPAHTPGSSPLSRGIPPLQPLFALGTRIIPALAGNTSDQLLGTAMPPDHPRSRGEYN